MKVKRKMIEINDEELEKVTGGAGRYDVVWKGETFKNQLDLYVARQDCWFSMIRYVPCDHYFFDNQKWNLVNQIDMLPNELFEMEYQGYWQE